VPLRGKRVVAGEVVQARSQDETLCMMTQLAAKIMPQFRPHPSAA
jgi:hypothetical protein